MATAARLDLGGRLFDRDDPSTRGVPALLGELLILQLDRRRTGGLVALHSVRDVEQSTVACIAVADEWHTGQVAERAHAVDHLAITGDSGVGESQVRRHRPVTRHVHGLEAHLFGDS